jgi:Xaa-Pro aminopeptidase
MKWTDKVAAVQDSLSERKWDGWLFYDFRKNNDLACQFLDISSDKMLTRRFFYWIPRQGNPIKIVHAVEAHVLDHLPGETRVYGSWHELHALLTHVLKGVNCVAMEYSPNNAIPTMSKVDAGTLEMIRELGVEVESSADLIQQHLCVWTEPQLQTHLEAARFLDRVASRVWELISDNLHRQQMLVESDVQQLILNEFKDNGFTSADPPICAVNAHSADPHYSSSQSRTEIRTGDFVLIDLWCKKAIPQAVYADITRVAVAASQPTERQQQLFEIVKKARDTAAAFVQTRFSRNEPLMGWEVDQVCRQVIVEAGYGPYFVHRTGHNIGEADHGIGANLDNFETYDRRLLLRGTCFSIEPGIYLPQEFGIRLEYDIYLPKKGSQIQITGGIQEHIECLL